MALSAAKLKVGDKHTECVVDNLTRTQLVQYAGASGDYNPLHSDEVYSVHAGYKGVFAHGMLTMGLTGKMLTNYVGDARLKKFGVRFTNQVWPGDILTSETKEGKVWEKESKRAGKLIFRERITEHRDQNGELVITARGVGVTTERPVDQKK